MTRRTTPIVIGCAVAMLAACSSSSGDRALDLDATSLPSTTTAAVAPTAAPTTPPVTDPPTTVEPSTLPATDPPTTVAETTELATTTEAATTTIAPSKEDEVRADFEIARLARHQCAYTPESCVYSSIAVSGSPMDVRTRAQMAMRLQYNLRAVAGKGDELIRVESVGFEGDFAFVTICGYDSVEIYDVADPANPDDDILYNGDVASARVRWEMHSVDGRWLMYQGTNLDRLDGGDLCGF